MKTMNMLLPGEENKVKRLPFFKKKIKEQNVSVLISIIYRERKLNDTGGRGEMFRKTSL